MRPKCFVFVKTHTHKRIVLYCSLWKPVSKSYIMFSKQKSHNISIECANVQHINKVIFCLMCVVQCWSWSAGNTIRFFFLSRSAILFLLISVSVQAIMRCMWAYGFCFGFALPICFVRCGFFSSSLCSFPIFVIHKSTYLVFLEQLIQSLSFHNVRQITFHFTFTKIAYVMKEASSINSRTLICY